MNQLYLGIRGFRFNNKHNHDIGVVMHSKSIQAPSKKKIKLSIPYMNGSYDFSTVATNGEINYDEREISVALGFPSANKEQLQILYSKTMEWLMGVGKQQLIFDDAIDYYYMAEVEKADTFQEVLTFGTLTVTFTVEPFKKGVTYVGDDVWDTFNFEEDKFQDVEFDVDSSSTMVTIYNPGRPIIPIINVDAPISIVFGTYSSDLHTGDNKDYKFKLQTGDNVIEIKGVGHIKFIFRKEML